MADEQNGAAQPENAPRIQILTQYVRDMSFENIAIQKGVAVDGKPDIKVQVNLDAQKRGDDRYEVIIRLKADSSINGAQVFLLEVDYGGIFHVENVPDEQLHPFLMIECPRLIFPYLRRVVGDVTRDGGFPPLNIEPIDFMGLYRANIARQQAEAAKQQPEGTA